MARTSIALYRAATTDFEWTYARVISRAYLMNAQNTNADWVKVRGWFSRAGLKKTSALADDEEEADKEKQLLDDMESEEALNGSATRTKKCPFIWFSFMLSSGCPVPNKDAPAAAGQVQMFSTFDPDCFYPVDQKVVSRAVIELKLVGAEPCTSFEPPNPIPIKDTLSKK